MPADTRKARRREAVAAFHGLPWRADYINNRGNGREWSAASKVDAVTKVIVFAPTLERLQEIVAAIDTALTEHRAPRSER